MVGKTELENSSKPRSNDSSQYLRNGPIKHNVPSWILNSEPREDGESEVAGLFPVPREIVSPWLFSEHPGSHRNVLTLLQSQRPTICLVGFSIAAEGLSQRVAMELRGKKLEFQLCNLPPTLFHCRGITALLLSFCLPLSSLLPP